MAKLKIIKPKKDRLVNVKVNSIEYNKMKENADMYCDGNISAWLRYSSINLKPKKSDIDN